MEAVDTVEVAEVREDVVELGSGRTGDLGDSCALPDLVELPLYPVH